MPNRLQNLLMMNEKASSDFLLFAIAKEYENEGNEVEAMHYYKELHRLYPNYVGTYYHYAVLLIKWEEKETAVKIIKEGISLCKSVGDKHSEGELQYLLLNQEED